MSGSHPSTAAPPPASATAGAAPSAPPAAKPVEPPKPAAPSLKLTDFMDVATLQEIQDAFAAVAAVRATITDADGRVLTQPVPSKEFVRRQQALQQEEDKLDGGDVAPTGPSKEGREYVAPIAVDGVRLGTIRMAGFSPGIDETKLGQVAERYGLDLKQIRTMLTSIQRLRGGRAAAIQFLFTIANAIARLCYQEYQIRRRINELTAVYSVTSILAEARDLQNVLNRTVRTVAEVMGVKAASIRLLDMEADELRIKAVHNLSKAYLTKGPIVMSRALIDQIALGPKGYEYVADMATDPRVQYPEEVQREGIATMMSVGMRYKGKAVGALRLYTDGPRTYSDSEIDMLKAIAAQVAASIENTRLAEEAVAAEQLEKQVRLAAEVQQRMVPQAPPALPGVEIASLYVPSFDLSGDLIDFIALPDDNLGLVIADVSGKGLPASLTMASVRAALRAQVDNVYYLYEVVRRINQMLFRDTRPEEFVTLFYGVLDARNRRLTYTDAGHPPGLLKRDGVVTELESLNMVLGVDPDAPYQQSVLDLKSGDQLLFYTDGLSEAMNFGHELFGKRRIIESLQKPAETAEQLLQNVLWDMRRFVGLAQGGDDVTMIAVQIA